MFTKVVSPFRLILKYCSFLFLLLDSKCALSFAILQHTSYSSVWKKTYVNEYASLTGRYLTNGSPRTVCALLARGRSECNVPHVTQYVAPRVGSSLVCPYGVVSVSDVIVHRPHHLGFLCSFFRCVLLQRAMLVATALGTIMPLLI